MDVIQICPPNKLTFTLPNDTHRILTITNLTLRSVFVHILQSHHFELSLAKHTFIMQAFQEVKMDIALRWSQSAENLSVGKLRIYYFEIDEETHHQTLLKQMFANPTNVLHSDICLSVSFDTSTTISLNYEQQLDEGKTSHCWVGKQTDKQLYIMKMLYPSNPTKQWLQSQILQHQLLNYLQHEDCISSIQPSDSCQRYVMEVKQQTPERCQFITFEVDSNYFIYVLTRIIAYGPDLSHQTLIKLHEKHHHKQIFGTSKEVVPDIIKQQQNNKTKLTAVSEIIVSQNINQEIKSKQKKTYLKQSFALTKKESNHRKRRNKSEEKICERSSQSQDEEQLMKKQLRNLRKGRDFDTILLPIKTKVQIKIKQTNIELGQKVLNILTQTQANSTEIYILLRDCVHCYVVEDPTVKRIFKFEPINEESIYMPCPMDLYQKELIFGNESYLFWVNLHTGDNEWTYVQRKHIYALAVIQELSLVAIGGKNFSKLSYFGKDTSRSNIKMYSCGSSDKHNHLFTYDMPGESVGNIANMVYLSTPPHGHKILLVHTLNQQNQSRFYFLRVKAFNKIEVYGQIDLDQLGILSLLKFKHNKATGRLMCMESLNESIDSFKKMKIRCQYEKVDVSTEGMKFPLGRYRSYHIGGGKANNEEWMSALEENGKVVHFYYFESNEYQRMELDREDVRQVFSVNKGQYLLMCTETMVSIRERQEVQVRE